MQYNIVHNCVTYPEYQWLLHTIIAHFIVQNIVQSPYFKGVELLHNEIHQDLTKIVHFSYK